MEREYGKRERKCHAEFREQEILERETKVQKAAKLAEKRVEKDVLVSMMTG